MIWLCCVHLQTSAGSRWRVMTGSRSPGPDNSRHPAADGQQHQPPQTGRLHIIRWITTDERQGTTSPTHILSYTLAHNWRHGGHTHPRLIHSAFVQLRSVTEWQGFAYLKLYPRFLHIFIEIYVYLHSWICYMKVQVFTYNYMHKLCPVILKSQGLVPTCLGRHILRKPITLYNMLFLFPVTYLS